MEFNGSGFRELSEENIFKKVSEFDLFSYYIPDFEKLNKKFSSPFRSDSTPSCSITEYNGKLFYKDFGSGQTYTIINFIKDLYNLNYYETLNVISNDFNLGLHNKEITGTSKGYIGESGLKVNSKVKPKETILKIKRREWNTSIDKEYWNPYGITLNILNRFNVFPLSSLWVNGSYIKVNKKSPSYAYVLDKGIYKILSPYSEYKWINNCKNHIQGYNQLPKSGKYLVITSSLKDCMVLYKHGITAIAPQSENSTIDNDIILKLKRRFAKVVVMFDNDEAGIESAKVYNKLYDLDYVHIPMGLPKDISDYSLEYGDSNTLNILKKLLI
jgi:hypothetical protein